MRRPVVVTHRIRIARWRGPALRIAVLSDLHVVAPWTSLAYLARVVSQVNALSPDLICLPGDFLAEPKLLGWAASARDTVAVLEGLRAPLGVHASLGNHDWKDCPLVRSGTGRNMGRNSVAEAFADSTIPLYINVAHDLGPFWIAGLDSSQSLGSTRKPKPRHDLAAALRGIPDGADTILLAHEPDVWIEERPDVALTLSGHTHAGQIALGAWRPLTPSRHGARYAHGAFVEDDRALVVSGGLGFTAIPVRIGAPPEITLVDLSSA